LTNRATRHRPQRPPTPIRERTERVIVAKGPSFTKIGSTRPLAIRTRAPSAVRKKSATRATFPRIASSPSQILPVIVVVVATSYTRPTAITRIFTKRTDCCEACRPTCSLAKRPRAAHAKAPRDSAPRDSSDRDSNAHTFSPRIDRRRDHRNLAVPADSDRRGSLFSFFRDDIWSPRRPDLKRQGARGKSADGCNARRRIRRRRSRRRILTASSS